MAVVSALGADAKSRVFYNRVTGEMQAAIAQLSYASVVIAQPSLLLGVPQGAAGGRNVLPLGVEGRCESDSDVWEAP